MSAFQPNASRQRSVTTARWPKSAKPGNGTTITIQRHNNKARIAAVVCIPLVIAIGLGCKYYPGPGRDWVNNWGPASVAYELLFMLIAFVLVPRRSAINRIALAVFVGTCLVEFSQLWKPAWLRAIRSTLPGRLVLGNSFSWWDFPAYLIGCWLGIFLLRWICSIGQDNQADANHSHD